MALLDYLKVKQVAEQWGISDRRVRVLCEQGKIEGVIRKGCAYLVPAGAVKPVDGRTLRSMNIESEYADLFARIDELKAELDKRRPLTQGELQCLLRDEFLVDYAYNSNAIEGNALTLKETAMVLEGITIGQKPLKDHMEAVGHSSISNKLIKDKTPFSERVIKEIHSLVLMDKPEGKGVYRRIPVRIMGAYHEPPQPYLVAPQMEQLVAELANTKLHPIEAAALFHLKFEGIHPFIDGSGRTGRLVLNFTLMQHGYPPINVKFADRKRYYEAFDSYYRDGDAGATVKMVAEHVEKRLQLHIQLKYSQLTIVEQASKSPVSY